MKTRKDKFGVFRTLHPHLDRDTRPEFILCRIAKWIPSGRTLFIASNERTLGFFSPLSVRYPSPYVGNFKPYYTKLFICKSNLTVLLICHFGKLSDCGLVL